MKKYQSHKVVEAAPLVAIRVEPGVDGGVAVLMDGEEVQLDGETGARIQAACAEGFPPVMLEGWLVRYADGYLSWSPAKAFEEGYVAID